MTDKVNLREKLTLFGERWSPRIVASYNANDIMIVKGGRTFFIAKSLD